MALNIVSPGPLTTVQDFGRHGHQAEGYPECGACDKYALALANLLCGNGGCPHVAGLEYTLCGPTVRAADYTLVALTGGTVLPTVNGKRVPMFEPLLLAPGDTLEIGMLSSGLRGYLAVFGGFDIRPVLGSRSTDLKCHIGGLSGRALKAGDVLPVLRAFELPQERYKPLKKRLEAVVLEDWALATLSPHGFIGAQKFPLLRVVLGPQATPLPKRVFLISNPRSTPSRRIPTAWPPSSAARRLRPRRAWTSSRTALSRVRCRFPQTASRL